MEARKTNNRPAHVKKTTSRAQGRGIGTEVTVASRLGEEVRRWDLALTMGQAAITFKSAASQFSTLMLKFPGRVLRAVKSPAHAMVSAQLIADAVS
jgi:hypothetical protein